MTGKLIEGAILEEDDAAKEHAAGVAADRVVLDALRLTAADSALKEIRAS